MDNDQPIEFYNQLADRIVLGLGADAGGGGVYIVAHVFIPRVEPVVRWRARRGGGGLVAGIGGVRRAAATSCWSVSGRKQRIAIEDVLGCCCVLRAGARRARHGVPLERIQGRGGRGALEDAGAEGVIAVGGGRTLGAEGDEAVGVIVDVGGGSAVS